MKVPATAILALGLAALTVAGPAAAGPTLRASVSDSGAQAQGFSGGPLIAAGGRFVVFTSFAPNLVPRDTNGVSDVFVRDLRDGTTRRVSVASGGAQSNGQSISDYGGPAILPMAASSLSIPKPPTWSPTTATAVRTSSSAIGTPN